MTFLELCQNLRREAAIAGGGPASVTDQTGMMAKVVNWVQRAWISIQAERANWAFLAGGEQTATLTSDVPEYAAVSFGITDMGVWDTAPGGTRVYGDSVGLAGEWVLAYVPWAVFRSRFLAGVIRTGRPQYYTVTPGGALRLYPTPDSVETYTLTANYFTAPVALVNGTDEPAIADHLQWVIVYKALLYYAASQDAPEVYADAGAAYKEWLERLTLAELPPVEVVMPAVGVT